MARQNIERASRLAAALRANLRRRKESARAAVATAPPMAGDRPRDDGPERALNLSGPSDPAVAAVQTSIGAREIGAPGR